MKRKIIIKIIFFIIGCVIGDFIASSIYPPIKQSVEKQHSEYEVTTTKGKLYIKSYCDYSEIPTVKCRDKKDIANAYNTEKQKAKERRISKRDNRKSKRKLKREFIKIKC